MSYNSITYEIFGIKIAKEKKGTFFFNQIFRIISTSKLGIIKL
jgi:hypothetical protein